MKKKILGMSDAWSTSGLSHWLSEPAYYIVDCQILTPPPFDPQLFCYFHVKLLVVKGRWRINRFFEPLHKKIMYWNEEKMEHSKIYSGSIIFLILTIFSSVHKFVCTYLIKKLNITNFTNSLPTNSNLQKTRKIFSHKWEILQ